MDFVLTNQEIIKIDNTEEIQKVLFLTHNQILLAGELSALIVYDLDTKKLIKKFRTKYRYVNPVRVSDTKIAAILECRDIDKLILFDTNTEEIETTLTEKIIFTSANKDKERVRLEVTEQGGFLLRFLHKSGTNIQITFFESEQLINKGTIKIINLPLFYSQFNRMNFITAVPVFSDAKITLNTENFDRSENKSLNFLNIQPKSGVLQYARQLYNDNNIIIGFNTNREGNNNLMAHWDIYNQNCVKLYRFFQSEYNIMNTRFLNQDDKIIGYFEHRTKQSKSKYTDYYNHTKYEKLYNFQLISYKHPMEKGKLKYKDNYIEYNVPSELYNNRAFIDFQCQILEKKHYFEKVIVRTRKLIDHKTLIAHLIEKSEICHKFGEQIVDLVINLTIKN